MRERFIVLSVVAGLVVSQLLAKDACAYEDVGLLANGYGGEYRSDHVRGITLAPIEDGRLGPVGYGSDVSRIAIEEIAALGGTWLSITPFGRMDTLESTDIQHDFEIPVQVNEDLIRKTAADARAFGLKVAIIPHIYVMNGDWRGEIDPGTEMAWATWFDSYTAFVLRFAKLAEELQAELFSIGVEFKSSTNYRGERWRALIAQIRQVYSGPLTYSANWDEADQVMFWDDLDAIGINAFWPLAKKPGDGYRVMEKMASHVADDLEALSFYYNRPVVFTEMGVKSATDSALAPWEWPEHCSSLAYNEEYQAVAYDAVFDVMTKRAWFAGLFIWKYFPDPWDETQEAQTGFALRNKIAETHLSNYFRSAWQ